MADPFTSGAVAMNCRFGAIVIVLSLVSPCLAGEGLSARLMPIIEKHEGDVAVAVKHLATGEHFEHRADQPQPTASLIKLPVMIEAYRQQAESGLDLGQMLVLKDSDKVPGSGILTQHFSDGASFSLRDAIRLMIAYSDNTATNLVLDKIGLKSTAETMEKLGCPNTKMHSKVFRRDTSVFPERSKQFGLGSTTAAEMIVLLEKLHREEIVTPAACREMIAHLKTCDDDKKFPRLLPAGTVLAFKTGSVNQSRTAAGILYTKSGPIALCVLTANNKDQRWTNDNAGDLVCAKVARAVFDQFQPAEAAGK
jgi:beta-lactamase class A